jgi:hypothetical protein
MVGEPQQCAGAFGDQVAKIAVANPVRVYGLDGCISACFEVHSGHSQQPTKLIKRPGSGVELHCAIISRGFSKYWSATAPLNRLLVAFGE